MEFKNGLLVHCSDTAFSAENMSEYNTLFDLLPFSIYWKDTKGVYLGRNCFAAEQMVFLGIEPVLEVDYVKSKTDFELFDFNTASQYRQNELITLCDPMNTHHFIETLNLPSGEIIEHISVKRCILNKKLHTIGTLSCTINIHKFMQPDKSLRDIVTENSLHKLHKLILNHMASSKASLHSEICETLLYLTNLYPNDHELRKLLLLTPRELQCLSLLLKNHLSKQIGAILAVSYRTVEIHISNIKEKLHLSSKQHIVDWFWNVLSQL
jgi:DNA-binding CsgD family transcriptional regulator